MTLNALSEPFTLVQPAYHTGPSYVSTLGPEVADLCDMVGFPPDPEQALALDALFGVDAAGDPASFEMAVIAPRQNLKTGLFKQASLGWLFLTDERVITWSAHEFATAREAFRDMAELIENTPWLNRRVERIWTSAGNEHIELRSGQRLQFKTRTDKGARGLSGSKVILDESFALRPEQLGALMPLMSAQGQRAQVVYGSSAGLVTSGSLRAIRDRGRAGTSPRLTYLEWCSTKQCEQERCTHAVGMPGCVLDDVNEWKAANPLLGRTRSNGTGMTVEYVAAERQAMPPWQFARERLGWWDDPGAAELFGHGKWNEARAVETPGLQLAAVGVHVSRDLSRAGIAGAGVGPARVEVKPLSAAPGVAWTVATLANLQLETGCKVVLDDKGPAAVLVSRLVDAGVELTLPSAADVMDACAGFYEGIRDRTVTHGWYPELDSAVDHATQAPKGTRWVFGAREPSDDITLLWAAVLAAWPLRGVPAPKRSYYETNRLEVI